MRDKYSPERVAQLHPKVRAEAVALIDKIEAGLPKHLAIRIVEHFRSIDYQNELYAKGRTKPGSIVTNAKGGSSYHNYGLAIDFAILVDKDGNGTYDELSWDIKKDNDKDGVADWLEAVKIFEAAGWEWGGKWSSIKDYPHVQKTFGKSVQQLLALYNSGQTFVDNGNKYVKL